MRYILIVVFLSVFGSIKAQETTYYLVNSVTVRALQGENLDTLYSSNLIDKKREYISYSNSVLNIGQGQFEVKEQVPTSISGEITLYGRSWLIDLIVNERGGELTLMDENGNVIYYELGGYITE